MSRSGYLPRHIVATASPTMVRTLLDSLLRLTLDDMRQAIDRNSEYRERATQQWATLLARRAREFYPELKC